MSVPAVWPIAFCSWKAPPAAVTAGRSKACLPMCATRQVCCRGCSTPDWPRLRCRPSAAPASQPDSSGPAKILVVDDDRGSRFALREVLLADGHEILEAENGQEALQICCKNLPDLILMDVRMPVMDGFTACRLIREIPDSETVQILVITGLNDEESIDHAFEGRRQRLHQQTYKFRGNAQARRPPAGRFEERTRCT